MTITQVATQKVDCLLSPVDLFKSFLAHDRPVFLDAVTPYMDEGGFSVIAMDPFLVIKAKGEKLVVERPFLGEKEELEGKPLDVLSEYCQRYQLHSEEIHVPFFGGAIGYLGYDVCRTLESIPDSNKGGDDPEDMQFGFYNKVIVYDHARREYHMYYSTFADGIGGEVPDIYEAIRGLGEVLAAATVAVGMLGVVQEAGFSQELVREDHQTKFIAAVERTQELIAAGDIFQANISEQFQYPILQHPYYYYQRLRKINPAPFAAFLCCDSLAVLSASPERFLRVKDGRIQTRPIKGTRKRGDQEDAERIMQELACSEKDRAELAMIIDVERNDLGKICQAGSVQVVQEYTVETLPTLYHLVSTVEGDLRVGVTPGEILTAMFPSGSITGAPKIRAMEIIDELECYRRGPYTGAIGFIGFNLNMDFNIAIRSIWTQAGKAYYSVGAGIVADSDPQAEYQEILAKGEALCQVFEGH